MIKQDNNRPTKITTIEGTNFFCIFDKNDASKNKVKQNLKQSKGCACETPLAEVFFFPGNSARKDLLTARSCCR
jgi:hypothetical protein